MQPPLDRPPIIMIGAMTRDLVIGQGDTMPWDVPEEYAQFLDQIRDQTVVIGRKSFEIFGKDLTAAYILVVSSRPLDVDPQASAEVIRCRDWDEVVPRATVLGKTIFIAGGSSIYQQGIEIADRMHLSEIPGQFEGDRHFPTWALEDWRLEREQQRPEYTYREYVRQR